MIAPYIRYGIHRDLPEIAHMEEYSEYGDDDFAWKDFMQKKRLRVLVICRRYVEAAIALRLRSGMIFVERLVSHHDFCQLNAASMFIEQICENMGRDKRLVLQIDERDLDWQLFLKEREFKATGVLRDVIEDKYGTHWAIQFEYGADLIAEMA